MRKNERDPVDDLGDIRAAIRVLQAQEQQLRSILLEERTEHRQGARFRVQIEDKKSRRLDRKKLPDYIVEDPTYWTETTTTFVRVFPLDASGDNGGHARRGNRGARGAEDDFDVFED